MLVVLARLRIAIHRPGFACDRCGPPTANPRPRGGSRCSCRPGIAAYPAPSSSARSSFRAATARTRCCPRRAFQRHSGCRRVGRYGPGRRRPPCRLSASRSRPPRRRMHTAGERRPPARRGHQNFARAVSRDACSAFAAWGRIRVRVDERGSRSNRLRTSPDSVSISLTRMRRKIERFERCDILRRRHGGVR